MELAVIWFVLVAFLFIAYVVLDGFDLGIGILHLLAHNDEERRLNLLAIAPIWDGNEVWLITAGGALFAAFPPVYATVFSSLYLALVFLLVAFIFRAVSFAFVYQFAKTTWQLFWHRAFGIASLIISCLLGVAFGNIMKGLPIDQAGEYAGGLLGLLHPYALYTGLYVALLFSFHGMLFLHYKVEGAYQERLRALIFRLWRFIIVGGFIFLIFTYFSLDVSLSVTRHPLFWLFSLAIIFSLLFIPAAIKSVQDFLAFVASCVMISGLFGLFALGVFPNLLTSTLDPVYSLTILNSSSSPYTLRVMLVIAVIGLPVVISYTIVVYRFFKGKVNSNDVFY